TDPLAETLQGKVTTAIAPAGVGRSVAVQSDGKILVAGYADGAFGLARYRGDGSLDTSFDGDGKVTTGVIGFDSNYGYSMAVQSDGKILVAGALYNNGTLDFDFALVRYNPDGSLDTSFDGDGKATTDFGSDFGRGVALQSDGKILVAGYTYARSS